MFVEIPPHPSVADFVRRVPGRSSRKVQQKFEHIHKRYWGQCALDQSCAGTGYNSDLLT